MAKYSVNKAHTAAGEACNLAAEMSKGLWILQYYTMCAKRVQEKGIDFHLIAKAKSGKLFLHLVLIYQLQKYKLKGDTQWKKYVN